MGMVAASVVIGMIQRALEARSRHKASLSVLSFVVTMLSLVYVGGCWLHHLENDRELEEIQEAKDYKVFTETVIMRRLFGFEIRPKYQRPLEVEVDDDKLLGEKVSAEVEADESTLEIWRRGHCVRPSYDYETTCQECAAELEAGLGFPNLLTNDMFGFTIDDGEDLVKFCDDMETNPRCILSCSMVLPSAGHINHCLVESIVDPINPFWYNGTCLKDRSRRGLCPNCHLLDGVFRDLAWGGFATESDKKFASRGQLYVAHKLNMELYAIPKRHWNLGGSMFFASTLFSTIGYGNYVPRTKASKWVIILLTVPGIALFGFAVAGVAKVILGTIQHFLDAAKHDRRIKISIKAGSTAAWLTAKERGTEVRKWLDRMHELDLDGNGELSFDEVLQAAMKANEHVYERSLLRAKSGGIIKNNETKASADQCSQNLDGVDYASGNLFTRGQVVRLFNMFDADKSGMLDANEAIALLMILDERRRIADASEDTEADIRLMLLLTVVYLFTSSLLYYHLQDDWDFLDSVYFVMISVTTVGLGDQVPNMNTNLAKFTWMVVVSTGLGLVGSVVGAVSKLIEHSSKLEAIDDEHDEDANGECTAHVSPLPSASVDEHKCEAPRTTPRRSQAAERMTTTPRSAKVVPATDQDVVGYYDAGVVQEDGVSPFAPQATTNDQPPRAFAGAVLLEDVDG